ncbi:hypothetical protein [Brevundimonas sp. FT23028]|uniref:hypothetical protein n=1 Tax=Brevundimonas sp. FT23028 TaxID=3393748 RepID=UPI003B589505
MAGQVDLTGRWTGVYFYPHDPVSNPDDDLPPTPFVAELSDTGGAVTGTTIEPDTLGGADQPDIPAIVDGHHDGAVLTFTKFSEGGGHDDPIDYTGQILDDGDTIVGSWSIYGDWSGTFRMQRRAVSESVAETVGAQAKR